MKSPIGLYLAEFRADPAPALVPEPADLAAFEPGDLDLMAGLLSDAGSLDLPQPEAALEAEMPAGDDLDMGPAVSEPALADIVAALEADHVSALAEARQQWAAQEGEALARCLTEALRALEERIAETLAPMLEPFLVRAAQLKALDELREAIRTLLGDESKDLIRVTGPADLLAALEAAHPGEPRLTFAIAETPDVTIAVADTVVRSRLQAWASNLEASLGEHP